MRKHIINIEPTKNDTISVKIQAEAGEIPDTICDTEMTYPEAHELMKELMGALDDATGSRSEIHTTLPSFVKK